jgi:beta-glucosidase
MNGILRKQWGWDGFVVSDYDAYANIFGTHHYTKDMEHAAAVGINAGMDQEGGGTSAISHLQAAITDGLTSAATVEQAFRRLMRMRIRLGMFDPPTLLKYNRLNKSDLQTKQATALNRQAAAEGMVLLKHGMHAGKHLLPLEAASLVGGKGSVRYAFSDRIWHSRGCHWFPRLRA